MSFKHNRDNIIKSIVKAKEMGASYRLGPELEVCGYSCEDHFFEPDTEKHSWEMLADIMSDENLTKDILCDIGIPAAFQGTLYNCRVYILNQRILLVRPKLYMADGNNYRENRYFKPWNPDNRELYDFKLPECVSKILGQKTAKFGVAIVKCNDTEIATEICEELWVPKNMHVELCLDGAEIISNSSGSHHELRKLNYRLDLIQNASARNKCVYMYSNLKGGDGGRLYFDGSSMITMNGEIYSQSPQFSINDIDISMAILDLDQVRALRLSNHSRGMPSTYVQRFQRVYADINICRNVKSMSMVSKSAPCKINTPMEEIAKGPALWMWDYLRRSGGRGFFLPLSGGADSSATAALVTSMAKIVFESITIDKNEDTLKQIRKVVKDETFNPKSF
mgnify:CR=1 FL=1